MGTRAWWLVLVIALSLAAAEVGWLGERLATHRARHATPVLTKDPGSIPALQRRKHLPIPITGFGPV